MESGKKIADLITSMDFVYKTDAIDTYKNVGKKTNTIALEEKKTP